MKKILIFLTVLLIAIVSLPIFGNKVVEDELLNRLDVLKSYGVEIKEESSLSYLSTTKHYELKIIDGDKFISYIQQFSDSQLPPYSKSMIDGITLGSDIMYSNFPLSDRVSIDIYPLSFPSKFTKNIMHEERAFLKYLDNILQTKAILYHMNYHILQSKFDGYIKDIQESYTLQDGTKINLTLIDSSFIGNGLLLAPERIDSTIKHISFNVIRPKESINLSLNNWNSTSNFASATTYAHGGKIKSFKLKAKGTVMGNVEMEFTKLHLNFSSNTQNKKAELYAKSSFEDFYIVQGDEKFRVGNFNYDISIKEIDKDSFEKLRILLLKSKVKLSDDIDQKIQTSFIELLSNGLELLIADFSIKKIDYQKEKNINGFSMKTNLLIKKDQNLPYNININPNIVAKNIQFDSTIKISKQMFAVITREAPIAMLAKAYANEEEKKLIFNFTFLDGNLSVNGKPLR